MYLYAWYVLFHYRTCFILRKLIAFYEQACSRTSWMKAFFCKPCYLWSVHKGKLCQQPSPGECCVSLHPLVLQDTKQEWMFSWLFSSVFLPYVMSGQVSKPGGRWRADLNCKRSSSLCFFLHPPLFYPCYFGAAVSHQTLQDSLKCPTICQLHTVCIPERVDQSGKGLL